LHHETLMAVGSAAARDENRGVPGQARLFLVQSSPSTRLTLGPSRHRELFAASTPFSIVDSVGPAGHHRNNRQNRRWWCGWKWSRRGARVSMSARTRWWRVYACPTTTADAAGRFERS
jgi:hypothetical protein